jgi:predicted short-subunit dehydrogenase-like oxidoreductase (DUF2520 family)
LLWAGDEVVAVSAVSDACRERAVWLLPGAVVLDPAQVCARASLVLLAVPDDALPELVSGLATVGAFQRGQLVAHVSGRHGLAVLAPAVGTLPMALHPVQTFTGTSLDVDRLHGIAFGVTSPQELRPIAEALVLEMGGEPVWVREQDRPLWHAALAHAANHLVTLVASSQDLLRSAGAEDPGRVLAPLLTAALDGALRRGDAALTGPVSRGDAGTVAAHLAALPHEVRPAYLALARLTADRALASGRLGAARAEGLLEVLA